MCRPSLLPLAVRRDINARLEWIIMPFGKNLSHIRENGKTQGVFCTYSGRVPFLCLKIAFLVLKAEKNETVDRTEPGEQMYRKDR